MHGPKDSGGDSSDGRDRQDRQDRRQIAALCILHPPCSVREGPKETIKKRKEKDRRGCPFLSHPQKSAASLLPCFLCLLLVSLSHFLCHPLSLSLSLSLFPPSLSHTHFLVIQPSLLAPFILFIRLIQSIHSLLNPILVLLLLTPYRHVAIPPRTDQQQKRYQCSFHYHDSRVSRDIQRYQNAL